MLPSYKLVRGALDFAGVVNRATSRSRYGYVKTLCMFEGYNDLCTVLRSPRRSRLQSSINLSCYSQKPMLGKVDTLVSYSVKLTRFPASRSISSLRCCVLLIFSISEFIA